MVDLIHTAGLRDQALRFAPITTLDRLGDSASVYD
jgi:hypothetical protein